MSLVDFRNQYPQYNDLSDEELADALHSKYYSDIDKDEYYKKLGIDTGEMGAIDYGLGMPLEIGKGLVRGFGQGVLSTASGAAQLADAATDLLGAEDLIDSGNENFLINLADQGTKSIEENFGVDEEYKDSYLVKLSEGLGSIGSIIGFGGVGGVAAKAGLKAFKAGEKALKTGERAGEFAGASLSGSAQLAQDQVNRIDEARARGIEVPEDVADKAILASGVVGLTEAYSPLSVLKKIRGIKGPQEELKVLKNKYDDYLKKGDEVEATSVLNQMLKKQREIDRVRNGYEYVQSALRQGSAEAIQEAVSGLAQDAIQYGMYDEDVSFTDSLWDDVTVGFGAGALLDAIGTGTANRRRKLLREVEEEKEKALRDQEDAQLKEYYDLVDKAKQKFEEEQQEALYDSARIEKHKMDMLATPEKLPRIINPYEKDTAIGDRIIVLDQEGNARSADIIDIYPDGGIAVLGKDGKPEVVGKDTPLNNSRNPHHRMGLDYGVENGAERPVSFFTDKELDTIEAKISNQLKQEVGEDIDPFVKQRTLVDINAVRNEKKRRRSKEFNPTAEYEGTKPDGPEKAAEYANQLATDAIRKTDTFPEVGQFGVIEEKRGEEGSVFKVIHSVDGNQYGTESVDRNFALQLAVSLNSELLNKRINAGVLDAINLAPEPYSPEQGESIYRIGQMLNRPKRHTITSAVLNEAAGTTTSPTSPYMEDMSLDALHVQTYGVPPFTDRGQKFYQDIPNLTLSQQINLDRVRKGLKETDEFTFQEAKDALGDKYPNLFNVLLDVKYPDTSQTKDAFGTVGVELERSRQQYQDEKRTREELKEVLNQKNILSDITSPEVKYVFNRIVNESDVNKMNPSQREYLVREIKKFPVIARPASLPNFTPKPYTKKQYDLILQDVISTEDGSRENIETIISEIFSEEFVGYRTPDIAKAIYDDLKKSGLIDKSDLPTVKPIGIEAPTPDPEVEPYKYVENISEEARRFESDLKERMKELGLEDVGLRVLDILKQPYITREGEAVLTGYADQEADPRTEAFMGSISRNIILGLDRAVAKIPELQRDESPESIRYALADVLNHELVHATRALDLWTEQEWSLLEGLAKKKIHPESIKRGKPQTFEQYTKPDYPDLNPVQQMEESIAELIRYGIKDRSLITGKPKSLVNRFYEFIERLINAFRGTGFQNFEDVINAFESGGIGKRERGQPRTLRALEDRLGAVPKRGIGKEYEVVDITADDGERTADIQDIRESRRKSSTPIESAVNLAKTKYEDYNTAVEEEFFGKFWPSLMSQIRGTVSRDKVRTAAKRAINDTEQFIKDNPKYKDYYAQDMIAVKAALESKYGPISDDELILYQLFNGLNSAQTSLPSNVGDALNVFRLYKDKGNLDDIVMGINKNGNVVIKESPFQISGASSPNKARSLKVIEQIIKRYGNEPNPVAAALEYFREGVPVKELHAFNREMGYKSNVGDIGAIKKLVKTATGQDELIPRMFIFGKKVGAYTLNLTGDSRFTTIDVWESRFIRSYFDYLFEKNTGLPVTVDEDVLFQDFSRMFKEEFDKRYDFDADPASLQAMRWFYMINSAKESGYQGASTNETISELTDRYIRRDEEGIDGSGRGRDGTVTDQVQATPEEVSRQSINEKIIESRNRDADKAVSSFDNRSPEDLLIAAANQNPEIRKAVSDQALLNEQPFSWQSMSHELDGYGNFDRFVYQIQDKFVGLKNIINQLNDYRERSGLSRIDIKDDPYIGEESIPGKIGDKTRSFDEYRKKPLAKKIADLGLSLEEVDEFLILRHAIERNNIIEKRDPQRGVESNPGSGILKTGEPLTNSLVKLKMNDRYGLSWNDAKGEWEGGNSRAKDLLEIAKDSDRIVNETIDTTVDGGLIDQDSADAIKNTYKYYTPMRGKDIEDDYAENVIIGASLSTKGRDYLRAMGRESAAQSPLGHILLNAERSIARAEKNKNFGQRLVKLVENNPNPDYWRVISPDDPNYTRAFEKKYTYVGSDPDLQGQKFSEIPEGMSKKDFIQQIKLIADNLTPAFDKDLIGVKIGGKQVYVELKDQRLKDAIVSMDIGTADKIVQKFSVVNRFLSMINTSLNPEFVIGNFSRDLQTALFNILGEQNMSKGKAKDQKLIKKVLKDVIPSMGVFYKGLRRYDQKDGTLKADFVGIDPRDQEDFREFISSGAKADWFHSRDPEDQLKTINAMIDMANGTLTGSFRKRYEQVMNFIEDANSSVENAVRFATFKASRDELLEAGVSREDAIARAASLAKNLTINFNRKGMQGDLINSLYLFFNASVQGTANFARGLFGPKGNPFSKEASRTKQGAVASLIAFGALSAMRAEEESEENPETGRSYYSEIPDYIKERNIVIMADNGREYYTIPLPYGYNVFHVLGQSSYEMIKGNISQEEGSSNILSAFFGSFSPIGVSNISVAPTVFQPSLELLQNENFFGSPIKRENFPTGTPYPESSLARTSTRTPFKEAARWLNELTGGNENEPGKVDISPDTLEHYFEFMLGGAGTFGMRSANLVEKAAKKEDIKLNEIPFYRRIKGEPDSRESMADFFERSDKIGQKIRQRDLLRGRERINYVKSNRSYINMSRDLKRAESELREIRREIREYRDKASRSPQNAIRYGQKVEAAYEEMNSVYNKFNKKYDKRVGRTN